MFIVYLGVLKIQQIRMSIFILSKLFFNYFLLTVYLGLTIYLRLAMGQEGGDVGAEVAQFAHH